MGGVGGENIAQKLGKKIVHLKKEISYVKSGVLKLCSTIKPMTKVYWKKLRGGEIFSSRSNANL